MTVVLRTEGSTNSRDVPFDVVLASPVAPLLAEEGALLEDEELLELALSHLDPHIDVFRSLRGAPAQVASERRVMRCER